jgi:hypothetical protein
MSDKASQEYITSQIDSDYQPSQWMVEPDLPDNNGEDIKSAHLVDGETENVIKVSPNDNEGVPPEYIFENEWGDDEEDNQYP